MLFSTNLKLQQKSDQKVSRGQSFRRQGTGTAPQLIHIFNNSVHVFIELLALLQDATFYITFYFILFHKLYDAEHCKPVFIHFFCCAPRCFELLDLKNNTCVFLVVFINVPSSFTRSIEVCHCIFYCLIVSVRLVSCAYIEATKTLLLMARELLQILQPCCVFFAPKRSFSPSRTACRNIVIAKRQKDFDVRWWLCYPIINEWNCACLIDWVVGARMQFYLLSHLLHKHTKKRFSLTCLEDNFICTCTCKRERNEQEKRWKRRRNSWRNEIRHIFNHSAIIRAQIAWYIYYGHQLHLLLFCASCLLLSALKLFKVINPI